MSGDSELKQALARLDDVSAITRRGRVTAVAGLVVRAMLPQSRIGDQVRLLRTHTTPLVAEVIGFSGDEVLLMPYGDTDGIGQDTTVETVESVAELKCGDGLLGRVLGGLGQPVDGVPLQGALTSWKLRRPAPAPLTRPRITDPLSFGLRAIDALMTIGEGQRVGLFAGSGVGKSTLLGQIARNASAEICIVCLVGERGREVGEFIDECLGEGLKRSVVVYATSDEPPVVRLRSADVATAIAEYFRDQGKRVLLLIDSITRYARALREVGLAAGELPARRGYPPSVFARLPRLFERAGTATTGSITAIYTVLVEGDDMDEPIADEVRGLLDGHLVLSRKLAERGHFPAIDPLQSLSRLMDKVTTKPHQQAAAKLRRVLATYERQRDLILLGAYQKGTDPETDQAVDLVDAINEFLTQPVLQRHDYEQTVTRLIDLAGTQQPAGDAA